MDPKVLLDGALALFVSDYFPLYAGERCADHFVVLYFVSERLYASPHCSSLFRLVSPLYFQLTLLCKFILKYICSFSPAALYVAALLALICSKNMIL